MNNGKVLVVDDTKVNLRIAEIFLNDYGLEVDCAGSGQEAILCIINKKAEYDIVFMDYMMEEFNGIQTVKKIRNEIGIEYAQRVPIIAYTDKINEENIKKFLANGFNDFLEKPIKKENLDKILKKWIGEKIGFNPAGCGGGL
ncbi:MAG: response regulator [Treponema sp.]|jgi:CheY-like chemotaxis protein|nr:response regulator [Treponema sp.]